MDAGKDLAVSPSAKRRNSISSPPSPSSPGRSGMMSLNDEEKMMAAAKENKHDKGWRRIVRNFTPSWFAGNMGTGIVSIILYELPFNADWVRYIAIGFFLLNVLLFSVFTLTTAARYCLYPETWGAMLRHPTQSLFLGCFPMGFATIVNMIVLVCSPWGTGWVYAAWVMWWIDIVLSVACCVSLPFIVMHQHRPALYSATATLLLPIVPAVVASASGAVVAEVLPSRSHSFLTVIISYMLFGMGECFSLLVLSMYFHRLYVHSLPPRDVVVSVFLPIGPLGQGGFAIQKLGAVLLSLDPIVTTAGRRLGGTSGGEAEGPHIGELSYGMGLFGALVLWGFGLVWLAFALLTIFTMRKFPFNMGWWGFTFPLGVFTSCTAVLGEELMSMALKVLATVFSLAVVLLWALVAVRTTCLAVSGEIFSAPGLQQDATTRDVGWKKGEGGSGSGAKSGGIDKGNQCDSSGSVQNS